MKGGRIVEHGTYKELLDRGVDFHSELGDGGQQTPQLSPAPSLTPANSMPGAGTACFVATGRLSLLFCSAGFAAPPDSPYAYILSCWHLCPLVASSHLSDCTWW